MSKKYEEDEKKKDYINYALTLQNMLKQKSENQRGNFTGRHFKKRRSREEMIRDILINANDDTKLGELQYGVNTSYAIFSEYLTSLVVGGFLEEKIEKIQVKGKVKIGGERYRDAKIYCCTATGGELLKNLNLVLNEINSIGMEK